MADDLRDEESYLAARAEQFAARMESEGVSRKKLLQLAGGALPLLVGGSRFAAPAAAQVQGAPISKPLPAEWFVPFGTNAEHGGTRSRTSDTRFRTIGSSSATTRPPRRSIPPRGVCACSATGCGPDQAPPTPWSSRSVTSSGYGRRS